MKLLNFNFSACCLEVSCDLLCVFLGDAFLNGLGSALNEVLSILKAEAAKILNDLDNVELGSTSVSKNNVELGLLLNGSCCCSAGSEIICRRTACSYSGRGLADFEYEKGQRICPFSLRVRLTQHKNEGSLRGESLLTAHPHSSYAQRISSFKDIISKIYHPFRKNGYH